MSPADGMSAGLWGAAFDESDAALLFDQSPFGIACLDPGGGIRRCNASLCRLFDRGLDALLGRAFADVFAAEDRDDVRVQLAKLVMGTARRVSIESVRLADGRAGERSVGLFVSAVEHGGETAGMLVHVHDVTERRELEVRFAHAQKLQALGQLAGSIAHDFNNLIAGMLGCCELLLSRAGEDDPGVEDLRQMRAGALRARDLVRQLLAFARRQPLRPIPLRLDRAVDQLAPMLRRVLGSAISVEVRCEPGVRPVRMDPGQFDQVIVNLCVNARDAMPGGGLLTLWVGQVTLSEPLRRRGEIVPPGCFVVVEVADRGTGIPREILDDIFQPFFTTKPTGDGTGLGLATVWGIVRQSGGHILVDSELGVGTAFRLFLPAVASAETGAGDPGAADPFGSGPGEEAVAGGATVLLVDDEEAVRRFAGRALRGRGYRVIEAADGEAALSALSRGNAVDVLLTDLALPDMRGTELIAEARRLRPGMRVVVISAELFDPQTDDDETTSPTLLPKPFTLAELVACVGRTLAS